MALLCLTYTFFIKPVSVEELMPKDVSTRVAAPLPKVKPPKIIQHLKNAEVMEGEK